MNQLKKHAAQAMLVVMVVSSCPTAQAINWDSWSECVSEKQKQFSNQIKKRKGTVASLMAVAVVAIGGYMYFRNQAVVRANGMIGGSGIRHDVKTPEANLQHVDTRSLAQDIGDFESCMKDWMSFFCPSTNMAQLGKRHAALKGYQEAVNKFNKS